MAGGNAQKAEGRNAAERHAGPLGREVYPYPAHEVGWEEIGYPAYRVSREEFA